MRILGWENGLSGQWVKGLGTTFRSLTKNGDAYDDDDADDDMRSSRHTVWKNPVVSGRRRASVAQHFRRSCTVAHPAPILTVGACSWHRRRPKGPDCTTDKKRA